MGAVALGYTLWNASSIQRKLDALSSKSKIKRPRTELTDTEKTLISQQVRQALDQHMGTQNIGGETDLKSQIAAAIDCNNRQTLEPLHQNIEQLKANHYAMAMAIWKLEESSNNKNYGRLSKRLGRLEKTGNLAYEKLARGLNIQHGLLMNLIPIVAGQNSGYSAPSRQSTPPSSSSSSSSSSTFSSSFSSGSSQSSSSSSSWSGVRRFFFGDGGAETRENLGHSDTGPDQ
jgi:hypothetical protein